MESVIIDEAAYRVDVKVWLEIENLRSRLTRYETALELVCDCCGGHENWNGKTREFLIAAETALAKATET